MTMAFKTAKTISLKSSVWNQSYMHKYGSNNGQNRIYECNLSSFDCVKMLKEINQQSTNSFNNWITSYQGGGWAHGTEFRNSEVSNDLDDIQKLINGKESHIFYNDGVWGIFDYKKLLGEVRTEAQAKNPCGIIVSFMVEYNALAHNNIGVYINIQ